MDWDEVVNGRREKRWEKVAGQTKSQLAVGHSKAVLTHRLLPELILINFILSRKYHFLNLF